MINKTQYKFYIRAFCVHSILFKCINAYIFYLTPPAEIKKMADFHIKDSIKIPLKGAFR